MVSGFADSDGLRSQHFQILMVSGFRNSDGFSSDGFRRQLFKILMVSEEAKIEF